jgi:hypothetical protein
MRQLHDTEKLAPETRDELRVLYEMLRAALPLARQRLMQGGVELYDQEAFWACYRDLTSYGDFDEEDNVSPTGIHAAIDELSEPA